MDNVAQFFYLQVRQSSDVNLRTLCLLSMKVIYIHFTTISPLIRLVLNLVNIKINPEYIGFQDYHNP